MSYVTDQLDTAADAIAAAMSDYNFEHSAEWLNLRDNVVPELDAIRARLHLAEIDERRTR